MPHRCARLDFGPEYRSNLKHALHVHGKSHLLVVLRALGQPCILTKIWQMKVLVIARDSGSYNSRCMDPMEPLGAKELDNQLAHT